MSFVVSEAARRFAAEFRQMGREVVPCAIEAWLERTAEFMNTIQGHLCPLPNQIVEGQPWDAEKLAIAIGDGRLMDVLPLKCWMDLESAVLA